MDVCILDQAGETLLHRHMTATPEALLKALAPSRDQIVLAAEGLLTWDWLADLCAAHGIPCVLGHALSMKALHGGQATNETIDAHTIAVLLRGGRLPQAYGSPAARRATRDLLRRRLPLARQRGALLAHVHHTNSQSTLPALGKNIADHPNRDGVAERFAAPAVPKSIAVDRALITSDDALRRDVERTIVKTAQPHDAPTLYRWHTGPGMGKVLSLVLLDALHLLDRFPRGQECASSCRLVTCAKASAGKRSGTSGTTIGHAPLQWACSAAAVVCLRENPAGQNCLASLEKKQRQGKALTSVAPPWARAVYDMGQHQTACDRPQVLQSEGTGGGQRDASRDHPGMPLSLHALPCTQDCVAARR